MSREERRGIERANRSEGTLELLFFLDHSNGSPYYLFSSRRHKLKRLGGNFEWEDEGGESKPPKSNF